MHCSESGLLACSVWFVMRGSWPLASEACGPDPRSVSVSTFTVCVASDKPEVPVVKAQTGSSVARRNSLGVQICSGTSLVVDSGLSLLSSSAAC